MRWTGLALASLAAMSAVAASAETWVGTPANKYGMVVQYDADSVYTQGGLIYAIVCNESACTGGQSRSQVRVDCTARTFASLLGGAEWGPPKTRADNDYLAGENQYLPDTTAAMTIDALCAKQGAWPKR
jgi:hypothetical protein